MLALAVVVVVIVVVMVKYANVRTIQPIERVTEAPAPPSGAGGHHARQRERCYVHSLRTSSKPCALNPDVCLKSPKS